MCATGKELAGGGSKPKPAPAPKKVVVAPPLVAPIEADGTSGGAVDNERKRRQAASGRSDTIMTRGEGLAGRVNVAARQLLGG